MYKMLSQYYTIFFYGKSLWKYDKKNLQKFVVPTVQCIIVNSMDAPTKTKNGRNLKTPNLFSPGQALKNLLMTPSPLNFRIAIFYNHFLMLFFF